MDIIKYTKQSDILIRGALHKIIKNIYDKRYVVNAKTNKESKQILDIFKSAGIEVSEYLYWNSFEDYKENLCYRIDLDSRCIYNYQICYGSKEAYISKGYRIVDIEYLIENGMIEL